MLAAGCHDVKSCVGRIDDQEAHRTQMVSGRDEWSGRGQARA